jgi:hypothetical protein
MISKWDTIAWTSNRWLCLCHHIGSSDVTSNGPNSTTYPQRRYQSHDENYPLHTNTSFVFFTLIERDASVQEWTKLEK